MTNSKRSKKNRNALRRTKKPKDPAKSNEPLHGKNPTFDHRAVVYCLVMFLLTILLIITWYIDIQNGVLEMGVFYTALLAALGYGLNYQRKTNGSKKEDPDDA
jgi:hypothetical protein